MWRLVLTTGFVGHDPLPGVLRLLSSSAGPADRRRSTSPAARCCSIAVLCFFVYDSLGSALFTAMIAVGLMARADLPRSRRCSRHDRPPTRRRTPPRSRGLLWPEPWDAPQVAQPAGRAAPRSATPTSSPARPAPAAGPGRRAGLGRHGPPARCRALRRRRSRPPRPRAGRAARVPRRGCAGRSSASRPRPGRRLDRDATSATASAPTCASASCSAPDGSTRSRCSRSSTGPGTSSATPRSATTTLTARPGASRGGGPARRSRSAGPRSFRVPDVLPHGHVGRPRGPACCRRSCTDPDRAVPAPRRLAAMREVARLGRRRRAGHSPRAGSGPGSVRTRTGSPAPPTGRRLAAAVDALERPARRRDASSSAAGTATGATGTWAWATADCSVWDWERFDARGPGRLRRAPPRRPGASDPESGRRQRQERTSSPRSTRRSTTLGVPRRPART